MTIKLSDIFNNLNVKLSLLDNFIDVISLCNDYISEFIDFVLTSKDDMIISANISWQYEQVLFNCDYILGKITIGDIAKYIYIKKDMIKKLDGFKPLFKEVGYDC